MVWPQRDPITNKMHRSCLDSLKVAIAKRDPGVRHHASVDQTILLLTQLFYDMFCNRGQQRAIAQSLAMPMILNQTSRISVTKPNIASNMSGKSGEQTP
ncbi:MAG: hypothetical protein AAFY26_04275 [Cyanobacteria bacterium J06638_22]